MRKEHHVLSSLRASMDHMPACISCITCRVSCVGGHCNALKPKYASAASKLGSVIPFANVNCDAEVNKPLCGRFGIRGFPTIKLFAGGRPSDYQGPRETGPLSKHALNALPSSGVQRLKGESDLAGWMKGEDGGSDVGHAILYVGSKSKVSSLIKAASLDWEGKFTFSYASMADFDADDLKDELGVEKAQTLVVRITETGELKVIADVGDYVTLSESLTSFAEPTYISAFEISNGAKPTKPAQKKKTDDGSGSGTGTGRYPKPKKQATGVVGAAEVVVLEADKTLQDVCAEKRCLVIAQNGDKPKTETAETKEEEEEQASDDEADEADDGDKGTADDETAQDDEADKQAEADDALGKVATTLAAEVDPDAFVVVRVYSAAAREADTLLQALWKASDGSDGAEAVFGLAKVGKKSKVAGIVIDSDDDTNALGAARAFVEKLVNGDIKTTRV